MKCQASLQKVQCQIEKKDIIFLPILPLDKTSIIKYINILKKYLKRLEIDNIAIINKLLIFKKDFFTICNVIRAIY